MKAERGTFRMLRREQLLQEFVHDSYKSSRKLPEPTCCPGCGAVFHKGRWTWNAAPAGAHAEMCPACHRVHDEFPAGFVMLNGGFFGQHHEEILKLVKNCEQKEKAEHPLERIIAIQKVDDGVQVTTTGLHLAREIAERLHHAYKGELVFHYNEEDHLLRASWSR